MDGGAALPLAIRTSRVFRKIDGRWRQVHHHGSMDDPKLLARYQALVRSAALSGESARREQAAAGETFRDYARAFQSLRPAAVVSYFDLPFALIADGGVSALADAVALEAFLGRVMENLKARGFARSEIAELCAERLSEQLVAVSARRSRRKADGSELERLGETYIFRRAGGAWKIAAAIVHEPLAILASVDSAGRLWASLRSGAPGFISAVDERTLRIAGHGHRDDPLLANLRADDRLGALVIDLAARSRLRVNGAAVLETDGAVRLALQQVYGNCQNYIQARTIVGTRAGEARAARRFEYLDRRLQSRIAGADTFFIATAHADAGADVSHRGGAPGFVRVESA